MTPEVEKKRRELFEARYPDINLERDKYRTEFYIALPTRALWEAWNAALDAAEIVFPNQRDEKYQDYYDDVEGGSFNYSRYLNDVRNAITATGLGLRIK